MITHSPPQDDEAFCFKLTIEAIYWIMVAMVFCQTRRSLCPLMKNAWAAKNKPDIEKQRERYKAAGSQSHMEKRTDGWGRRRAEVWVFVFTGRSGRLEIRLWDATLDTGVKHPENVLFWWKQVAVNSHYVVFCLFPPKKLGLILFFFSIHIQFQPPDNVMSLSLRKLTSITIT